MVICGNLGYHSAVSKPHTQIRSYQNTISITPTLKEENKVFQKGYNALAGIDEAGRGPLAGPVVAAAVIFQAEKLKKWLNFGIKDSKVLAEKKRGKIYRLIKKEASQWAVGVVGCRIIDQTNILQAAKKAMIMAVKNLEKQPDFLLIDGNQTLTDYYRDQKAIVNADQDCLSVATASIIAKEYRDDIMRRYHKKYPQYGFDQHKGYGTKKHRQMIKKHGACPIHRMSFSPLKNYGTSQN